MEISQEKLATCYFLVNYHLKSICVHKGSFLVNGLQVEENIALNKLAGPNRMCHVINLHLAKNCPF